MMFKKIISKLLGSGSSEKGQKEDSKPQLIATRNNDNQAALIFVHGFSGGVNKTWKYFLPHIISDQRLNDWDIYSIGYPTNLSVDLPIWTSDPAIKLCATELVTKTKLPPLDRYKAISLVAHSMGGLIVQRAILDNYQLRQRLTHVMLFGTPSAGVAKATLGARLKKQARDMQTDSPFIKELRKEWSECIGDQPHFSFKSVAGDTDAFIPPTSSLEPFPESQQEAVPGNHLDIVRPDSIHHPSYELLYKVLTNSRGSHSPTESARLAAEHKQYERVIDLLMPGKKGLDAEAIVTLALALESVDRQDEATEVIEFWNSKSKRKELDPIGVLAGRLKRRWLVFRQQIDLSRALDLYREGLKNAEAETDHEQAYYHSINVAYLQLMSTPVKKPVGADVKAMANTALAHVEESSKTQWSYATTGEALLILGKLDSASEAYKEAKALSETLRERESMYMQASSVANRIYGEKGIKVVDQVFIP